MKNEVKFSETARNLDQLISKLSENEILNTEAMSYVKGGSTDGEANGGGSVLITPKF
jgi:hypothetical protein